MDQEENWISLIRSIKRVGKILNIDLTEADMPQPFDWRYASALNQRLWNLVRLKRADGPPR